MRCSGGKSDPSRVTAERVAAFLSEQALVPPGGALVVAVSGGADSICLLDILRRSIDDADRRLLVVHVDHGFRPDSAADARFVEDAAARLGLRCEIAAEDGLAYARSRGIGLEQAGRALRYRLLAAAAERHGAQLVATGHTRDDSVESVLMHLLRGAGIDGLRGIAGRETLDLRSMTPRPVEAPGHITLLRPLLVLRRTQTVEYCRLRGLAWRNDPTNDDPTFLRNRVRHHLLPVMRTYNPSIDAAIARTAEVLRDDSAFLDEITARRFRRVAVVGASEVSMTLSAWLHQPRAGRRRLFRQAVSRLGKSGVGLDFATTERAVAHIDAGRSEPLKLPGHLSVSTSEGTVRLQRDGCP